jgi:hypothetical protein
MTGLDWEAARFALFPAGLLYILMKIDKVIKSEERLEADVHISDGGRETVDRARRSYHQRLYDTGDSGRS